jgi:hypothetical protein
MLWDIVIILMPLWLLGLITAYTLAGSIPSDLLGHPSVDSDYARSKWWGLDGSRNTLP